MRSLLYPVFCLVESDDTREMENVSRGVDAGQHGVPRVQEYRLPSPLSIKCNVLRESLSEDGQNIPCATLKSRGSWVISIYQHTMLLLA